MRRHKQQQRQQSSFTLKQQHQRGSSTTSNNLLNLTINIVIISCCCLIQQTLTMPTAEFEAHRLDEPKFVVITEDVIPDVENTTQKVIRVNPLDLPPIRDDPTGSSDSDLYKIKALLPAHRTYVDTKRMRRPRPTKVPQQMSSEDQQQLIPAASNETPIIHRLSPPPPNGGVGKFQKPKHQQSHKKKKLHFLYNQETLDGRSVGKSMRVHFAPGAYPVYYAVSKSNGRFGKYPIKGFQTEKDFQKYLLKSKLEPIALKERYELS